MKNHEVTVGASFYSVREDELLKNAKSCKCDNYKCFKCQCRKQAIRAGLITKQEEEDFLFGEDE
jgi:hypothetical protein